MEPGDIVQITDPSDNWYPCLLIVSEVKSWGIQGCVIMPTPKGTREAYYRIENGKFQVVGKAILVSA